jgi:hypothetical protein
MARPRLPVKWSPNTSLIEKDAEGRTLRRRFFGADGRAIKNIDYIPHRGQTGPHAHDWDWTKTPPRQPARSLRPGE